MKVLAVCHMFPSKINPGNGVFVKERIKYVAKRVDLRMIAPVPYFPLIHLTGKYRNIDKVEFKENIDTLTVFHPRYFLIPKFMKFLDGYLFYKSLNAYFQEIIKEHNPDILDFHWTYPEIVAGVKWAKGTGRKVIVTVRGNEALFRFEDSIRKEILKHSLQQVDNIISVSDDLKLKLISEFGIPGEKITVIGNGIDVCQFNVIEKNEARKQCNLQQDGKYILSLCRLSQEKGLENLLKAFSDNSFKDATLLIAGDGPLRKTLYELAKTLHVSSRVVFLGAIEHRETAKWYNASDVYCLPSLREGCPNTVIESLACGTPVVSTKVGAVPELVKENSGFVVAPGDCIGLREALDRSLKIEWDRKKIAASGQNRSWDNVADEVIRVYEKVLN
jgi:glycosyltransferase involved in cell wall biosynthesis